jgi:hypothetical protein
MTHGQPDDPPAPPSGFWEQTHQLLRHERELWQAGIDVPDWWPSPDTSSPEAVDPRGTPPAS